MLGREVEGGGREEVVMGDSVIALVWERDGGGVGRDHVV